MTKQELRRTTGDVSVGRGILRQPALPRFKSSKEQLAAFERQLAGIYPWQSSDFEGVLAGITLAAADARETIVSEKAGAQVVTPAKAETSPYSGKPRTATSFDIGGNIEALGAPQSLFTPPVLAWDSHSEEAKIIHEDTKAKAIKQASKETTLAVLETFGALEVAEEIMAWMVETLLDDHRIGYPIAAFESSGLPVFGRPVSLECPCLWNARVRYRQGGL